MTVFVNRDAESTILLTFAGLDFAHADCDAESLVGADTNLGLRCAERLRELDGASRTVG